MSLPRIAIVGRPNVGKSSLFNRLVGRRISIVDPTPGVTRDRVTGVVELTAPVELEDTEPRFAELTDTGGYGVYVGEGARFDDAGADLALLTESIEAQIRFATREAELVLFVLDAHQGVTALDRTIASLLRKQGTSEKVMLVVNKVDDESWMAHVAEFNALGFGDPFPVSAKSGFGRAGLSDRLWEHVGGGGDVAREERLKFAIVGERNAGKSTLINALAGQPRVIVSEIAGTTRDSVDVELDIGGHRLLAIDTAGVRKRKSWSDDVEYFSNLRAKDAMLRADVCIFLVDATKEISQVEKKLSLELQKQFKPTLIAINKFDLVEDSLQPQQYVDYLTQELRGLDYAPLVFISAKESSGLDELLKLVLNLKRQADHRESTGKMNRIIEEIISERGPSSKLGTRAKILFAAQVATAPPTVVLVVNKPALFTPGYRRYLMNRLRERLPFSEIPIRMVITERNRVSLSALKGGDRRATDQLLDDDDPEGAPIDP
ncbi:MAG: ribosome biogenesis GTPase Der [Planctomycetota bacterium]|nr:ribosome biogenesis GTPase Der [Planctomycetota bacterium]MEC9157012.1 ribosome biogenesis GTPase Der [Planctomycetota bacterium]MEC9232555.1 ribosome biogenesis GTPase Der [Planctomycetota bacterium]MED5506620.1 ribosome biogenesis GTPase Der [Planctomycetota bacterium]